MSFKSKLGPPPPMLTPDSVEFPVDFDQRAKLQEFVAYIGPKGVRYVWMVTGERWVVSGVNARIPGHIYTERVTGLKATDWLHRYRSVIA